MIHMIQRNVIIFCYACAYASVTAFNMGWTIDRQTTVALSLISYELVPWLLVFLVKFVIVRKDLINTTE